MEGGEPNGITEAINKSTNNKKKRKKTETEAEKPYKAKTTKKPKATNIESKVSLPTPSPPPPAKSEPPKLLNISCKVDKAIYLGQYDVAKGKMVQTRLPGPGLGVPDGYQLHPVFGRKRYRKKPSSPEPAPPVPKPPTPPPPPPPPPQATSSKVVSESTLGYSKETKWFNNAPQVYSCTCCENDYSSIEAFRAHKPTCERVRVYERIDPRFPSVPAKSPKRKSKQLPKQDFYPVEIRPSDLPASAAVAVAAAAVMQVAKAAAAAAATASLPSTPTKPPTTTTLPIGKPCKFTMYQGPKPKKPKAPKTANAKK